MRTEVNNETGPLVLIEFLQLLRDSETVVGPGFLLLSPSCFSDPPDFLVFWEIIAFGWMYRKPTNGKRD